MRKVLVVDDCDLILKAMQRSLRGFGWDVSIASTAEEAKEKCKDVNVILTDWDPHGLAVLNSCHKPAIVFTGNSIDHVKAEAPRRVEVYAKPTAPEQIHEALMRVGGFI